MVRPMDRSYIAETGMENIVSSLAKPLGSSSCLSFSQHDPRRVVGSCVSYPSSFSQRYGVKKDATFLFCISTNSCRYPMELLTFLYVGSSLVVQEQEQEHEREREWAGVLRFSHVLIIVTIAEKIT